MDIDTCRYYSKYADLRKTLSLGCKNCGKLAWHHADACRKCNGTGQLMVDDMYDDALMCAHCGGAGRQDGIYLDTI